MNNVFSVNRSVVRRRCLHKSAFTVTMAYLLSATTPMKRFVTASHADITKIRQDRHEVKTKNCTKWAVNLFNGKLIMNSYIV